MNPEFRGIEMNTYSVTTETATGMRYKPRSAWGTHLTVFSSDEPKVPGLLFGRMRGPKREDGKKAWQVGTGKQFALRSKATLRRVIKTLEENGFSSECPA